MPFVIAILIAGLPLVWATWANRRTALVHSLAWAAAAWLAWLGDAAIGSIVSRYVALSFTGCAGVAVLGARRPGAPAWNAVVFGLLAVLMLPLGRRVFANVELPIDPILVGFLAAALGVGLINFLPTRGGLGAIAILIACFIAMRRIDSELDPVSRAWSLALAAAAPWLAAIPIAMRRRADDADSRWRDFRDRFGVVWAVRLREQFNRAAENAGPKVELGWGGLRRLDGKPLSESDRAASEDLLSALMKRFGLA